jgi:hypothetical protein
MSAWLLYPICLYQLGTRALHHTIRHLTQKEHRPA